MSRFLLDTDILSLLQQGHLAVVNRVNQTSVLDIAISTITLWEQLQGWQASLTRARDRKQLAVAHQRIVARLLPTWSLFSVIAMTEPALHRFDQLVSMRLNVGAMDLRIAAVALEYNLAVVTRNLRDFQRVPMLVAEDWSA